MEELEARGRSRANEGGASSGRSKRKAGSSCSSVIGLVGVVLALVYFNLPEVREAIALLGAELPFVGSGDVELPVPTLILDTEGERALEGVTEGDVRASEVAEQECDGGYIRREPDVRVQTLNEGIVHFNAAGPGDLTLVVHRSDGVWLCDDDSGDGVLPRIVESLPVGVHDVWVGRFSSADTLAYRLTVSEDMPGLPAPLPSDEAKPEDAPSSHRSKRHRRRTPPDTPSTNTPATDTPSMAEAEARAVSDEPVPAAANGPRGLLSVTTTPWARVRINGRVIGNTPRPNVVVPTGEVRVEVQREGQGPWERLPARVTAGEPLRLDHTFD